MDTGSLILGSNFPIKSILNGHPRKITIPVLLTSISTSQIQNNVLLLEFAWFMKFCS